MAVQPNSFSATLRRAFPAPCKRLLRDIALRAQRHVLSPLKLRRGALSHWWKARDGVSLARLRLNLGPEPLSDMWGYERGEIISRYYLQQFLREYRGDLGGHCLEFQEDEYATKFGGNGIAKLDILHVDDSNPQATIIADLTKPNAIPDHTFDCIICTYVLHLICEADKAVADLYRILKPGGVLLVAVPHISMDGKPRWQEFWRYTPEGLTQLLGRAFDLKDVVVRAYGNSLTAAGELRGLVVSEFTPEELNYQDSRFALTVCARALKQHRSV